jgi:hypothetical protein
MGYSFCSTWVWPSGDAQQIAREPVSCDSIVCMELPIKGPMFDRACLRMRCGYLGILLGLVRRPGQEFHSGSNNTAFAQVGS